MTGSSSSAPTCASTCAEPECNATRPITRAWPDRSWVGNRRAGSRLLYKLAQRFGRGVALDREAHGYLLVAVPRIGAEPDDAVEVGVAGDRGADLGELDPAGGGDVGQVGGEADGQRMQHELGGRGPVVLAHQDARGDRRRRRRCARALLTDAEV